MNDNFTAEQKLAIKTIDRNVAVSAGAGSGKTRVLVERYVYLLKNGKLKPNGEVESILAITFTNKAAQEMKERVRKTIKDKKGKQWNRIYRDLERGNISTIHSFCAKLIRENPIECNVNPGFVVMEDYEADQLLYESCIETLNEGIENDDDIYSFANHLKAVRLDFLCQPIMKLYKDLRSQNISIDKAQKLTIHTIENMDESIVDKIKYKFEYLIEKASTRSKLYRLKEDQIWLDFKNDGNYELNDEFANKLMYLKDNIGTMKGEEETIDNLKSDIDEVLIFMEKNYENIYIGLIKILNSVDRVYEKKKRDRASLDYEDLQLKVLKLLDNKIIRNEYQERFQYIMVDEFQDTNELQKDIIYKLCSKENVLDRENLFIVGDPKQAIYGFRGADVNVFYQVMRDMDNIYGSKPINLDKNFRSIDTILNFINCIFKNIMGDKYKSLVPDNQSKNNVDVEIIENSDAEVPEGMTKSEYNKVYESRLIAKRIKKLVECENYEYGDIAMLFRSSTDDYIYEEALKEFGIPYYNFGGKGFYRAQEIVDVINTLKGISNKYDNVSLAGALRSPMFGLSDDTIYYLARNKNESLLDALSMDISKVDELENEKVKKANNILSILYQKKHIIGVDYLIKELLDKTYYPEILMLKFGGKQALANIYKFIDIAEGFINRENNSLEDFLEYIDELEREDYDESQAKIESEKSNTVKIMTIHKAKGLQFKVVVLPQMGKKFYYGSSDIVFDKFYGIGIAHEGISPLYSKITNNKRKAEFEENKRILYVAMTRAEDKLIIGNQGGNKESFKGLVEDYLDLVDYDEISEVNIESEPVCEIKRLNEEFKDTKSYRDLYSSSLITKFDTFGGKYFKTYSITHYLTFNQCQRMFYMTYYKKLPIYELKNNKRNSDDFCLISAMDLGNIVHRFCETYELNMNVEELLNSIIISYGFEPTTELLQKINPYIKNYISFHKKEADYIYREIPFYYKIQENYIRGVFDRINIINGKAEIIDFKTNIIKDKNYLINMYKPQIQLYTRAFKDISGYEVDKAGFMLLETGEFVDIDIDDDSLNRNVNNIKEFINFVSQNNNIESYKKNKSCNDYCNFIKICNKIKGD